MCAQFIPGGRFPLHWALDNITDPKDSDMLEAVVATFLEKKPEEVKRLDQVSIKHREPFTETIHVLTRPVVPPSPLCVFPLGSLSPSTN